MTVLLFEILFLLVTKWIDGHDLRRGIVGDGGVKPLSIVAFFISLVRNGHNSSLPFGAETDYLTYRFISQFLSMRPEFLGSSRSGWPARADLLARSSTRTSGYLSSSPLLSEP